MKILREKTTDSAVVGVVTAILIVGLIVAVVSLVQTMYIPKIMKEREADHMDKVAEQFTYLTSVIDGQAANPTNNMPVATSITLGSKELPYMLSMKAFGTLEILDDPVLDNLRTIKVVSSSESKTYQIGVITYSSKNGYFLDQNYTFEAGAMIVSQSSTVDGNLMIIRPSFSVDYNSTWPHERLNISFAVVNISSVGNKTIASGFGTYPIQTEFYNISYKNFTNVDSMTITTPLSNSWYVFMNRSIYSALKGSGLYTKNLIDYTSQSVVLHLSLFPKPVNVKLKIINIQAQIGPGWVE
jgi:hypothetical protein